MTCVPHVDEETKIFLEHNTSHMELRKHGSLQLTKESAVSLCGMVVSLFQTIVSNKCLIDELRQSIASSRAGLMTLWKIVDLTTDQV